MMALLRAGSIVLVDGSVRKIDDGDWTTEHDRPMYFVEVRDGYRSGWFHQQRSQLVMQPHPLSHCVPQMWRSSGTAGTLGRPIGRVARPVCAAPRPSMDSPHKSPRAVTQRRVDSTR